MEFLGGMLIAAAVFGWAATVLTRRHPWVVWVLAGLGIVMAWWYVAGADPNRELDGLGRVILVSFPVAGWLLGITATSVWVFAQRSGEKSRDHSRPARS